jgi:dethiobiotin synthetase
MNICGLFITGTDTGVGKTYVTTAIARQWRREGRSFRVMKPLATGDGTDTRLLAAAAEDPDLSGITPFAFEAPAAPSVAAQLAGVELSLREILQAIEARAAGTEALLLEGVGGLLCPINQRDTVADLVAALRVPVVIVARRALGTLNHTLLTLEAAQNRGLRVRGVVVSETHHPEGIAEQTNLAELQRLCHVLALLPFGADRLDSVDWWSLVGGDVH